MDGFISKTANFNPFVEPYLTANQQVNGQPVRSLQSWYDWNDYIDEKSYVTALRNAHLRHWTKRPCNRLNRLSKPSTMSTKMCGRRLRT